MSGKLLHRAAFGCNQRLETDAETDAEMPPLRGRLAPLMWNRKARPRASHPGDMRMIK